MSKTARGLIDFPIAQLKIYNGRVSREGQIRLRWRRCASGTGAYFYETASVRGKKRGKVHRVISGITKATSDETEIAHRVICSVI